MKVWLLKRNHQLFNQLSLTKKLLLKIIKDDDCAFQRNIKAVEYIDSITNQCAEFKEIRKILTKFETKEVEE